MGIAGFSPSVFRISGMAMLSPIQALVAFFLPVQSARERDRPVVRLPVQRMLKMRNTTKQTRAVASARPVARLKVVREFDPCNKCSTAGRMVISGRMADVCAELERIASKESA